MAHMCCWSASRWLPLTVLFECWCQRAHMLSALQRAAAPRSDRLTAELRHAPCGEGGPGATGDHASGWSGRSGNAAASLVASGLCLTADDHCHEPRWRQRSRRAPRCVSVSLYGTGFKCRMLTTERQSCQTKTASSRGRITGCADDSWRCRMLAADRSK